MYLSEAILSSTYPTAPSRVYGVVIALVTNNQDPKRLGRVRLKFPWLSDKDESAWARIATPMAGKDRGVYFLPEVDDEVLVAFEHGEVRMPYVVGFLWNGKDTPPLKQEDEKNNLKMIKSRSGHVIILNDEDGAETIEIIDRSGKNTFVINTSENSITLTSEKDITLSAPKGAITLNAKKLNFQSKEDTKMEAGTNLDIKSSGQMKLKGATIDLN
jgi:uncharacterized protein involved in type VI secretion and phage assembly